MDASFVTASEMSSQANTLRGKATVPPVPVPVAIPPPTVMIESPQPTVTPTTASMLGDTSADTQTPTPTTSTIAARRASIVSHTQTVSVSPPGPVLSLSPTARPFSLLMGASSPTAEDGGGDTDEEDEFFDAIEANTLPNLVITKSLIQPAPAQFFLSREVYAGYLKLRDRLSISSDDRPPMSLWAVLKNSIGKDLTKISFPVFFNEPTLQNGGPQQQQKVNSGLGGFGGNGYGLAIQAGTGLSGWAEEEIPAQ